MQHLRTETKSVPRKPQLGRKELKTKNFAFKGGKMRLLYFEVALESPKWLRGQVQ